MPAGDAPARSVFDSAAAEYDAARPSYPAGLFDELEARTGELAGRTVLDWGAGTGIASRQLAARGARVVCLDIGEQMLRRARDRSPRSHCVLADGNQMPVRDQAADLTTFAQSWHWFGQPTASAEVARVLRPGGYFAAWWNRARAEGEPWFGQYQELVSASCPSYAWQHASDQRIAPEWSDPAVQAVGRLEQTGTVVVPWLRRVRAADWITDERSKSYFIELEPTARDSVLGQVAAIIAGRFPDGQMEVPYVTVLTLARKAG
jgi:ubiquinone/menaquinone biosynthesis C-methylase UbiE